MKSISFDDLARNLLVFLKGQVPSLATRTTRDEIQRQLQVITVTLRSAIVQLEGAAYSDTRNSEDFKQLTDQINELKNTNTKLEESLFLEMNKTQELQEKLKGAQNELENCSGSSDEWQQKIDELKMSYSQEYDKLKTDYSREYEALEKQYIDLKASTENIIEAPKNVVDESICEELRTQLADTENRLSGTEEQLNQLKQVLQKRSIELSNSKAALMEAMKMDDSQIKSLKKQLEEISQVKDENRQLKAKQAELMDKIAELPSREAVRNSLTAAEAKVSYLEKELAAAKAEIQKMTQSTSNVSFEAVARENEQLHQQIVDLEATLRSVIKARENSPKVGKFSFSPEACASLFETLYSTVSRLASSPENRDICTKSNEAIKLLEDSKAIEHIASVGEVYDPKLHKAGKSFMCSFLPDNIIVKELSPGFLSGNKVIQKSVVWVAKSVFLCSECSNKCRPHEFFCPKCGLELTAPDGSSKRDLAALPTNPEDSAPLIDRLAAQGNYKAANSLIDYLLKENPGSQTLMKQKSLLGLSSVTSSEE